MRSESVARLRADLMELLEYLRGAEARAERSGDELLQQDPEGNRYAAEAGSLLASCDEAIKRLESLLARLNRVEGEPPGGGGQTGRHDVR